MSSPSKDWLKETFKPITSSGTFRVTGNDLSALYEKAQTQSEEIRNFLISQGIKAQDISQGTPSVQDLHADFYGNNLPPERYRMEMAVSVATTDVDTVLKAMVNQSELIQKGVLFTQNYRTQFSFNGLNSIKPEMVEEATKNDPPLKNLPKTAIVN